MDAVAMLPASVHRSPVQPHRENTAPVPLLGLTGLTYSEVKQVARCAPPQAVQNPPPGAGLPRGRRKLLVGVVQTQEETF